MPPPYEAGGITNTVLSTMVVAKSIYTDIDTDTYADTI